MYVALRGVDCAADHRRLHARSAAFCLAAILIAMIAMLGAAAAAGTKLNVTWPGLFVILAIFSALSWGFFHYRGRPTDRRLSLAMGSLLSIAAAGSAGGVISQVGQTFAFPLIDDWLAMLDRLVGLSGFDAIAWTVRVPGLISALAMAYALSIPLIILSALVLSLRGHDDRVWELCTAFAFCMLVATVASALYPAAGPFEHLVIPPDLRAQLPSGAGDYHLAAFHALRGASEFQIDPLHLQGLVTFPSFHTTMALMTAAAWRDNRILRWPMLGCSLFVILSTLPIGGHYLVDLLGGLICWGLIFYWPLFRRSLSTGMSVDPPLAFGIELR